jgi:hypothetical protein
MDNDKKGPIVACGKILSNIGNLRKRRARRVARHFCLYLLYNINKCEVAIFKKIIIDYCNKARSGSRDSPELLLMF